MVYSPQRMIPVLRFFALIYQTGSRINNYLYEKGIRKVNRASMPVISIGNLAFGGTGKTPLVKKLLSYFLEHDLRPALITRGYKGRWERGGGILSDGEKTYGTWRDAGDEPFMVTREFPQVGVYIGRKRSISCLRAKKAGFSIAILDDGFQHRKLGRDLDIVLFEPGHRTILREPISSLHRANMILVKETADLYARDRLKKDFPGAKIFSYAIKNKGFFSYPEDRPISSDGLKEKNLLAVCGIARPERFFSLLEEEGIQPRLSLAFPDHYAYPPSTRKKIISAIHRIRADALITTEKDVFKLDTIFEAEPLPVFYNKIDLKVESHFYENLKSLKKEG